MTELYLSSIIFSIEITEAWTGSFQKKREMIAQSEYVQFNSNNTKHTFDARVLCAKTYNLSPSVAEQIHKILPHASLNQKNQERGDIYLGEKAISNKQNDRIIQIVILTHQHQRFQCST
jgi:hypothetical protein